MSSEVVATGQGHSSSVKAAKFLSPNQVVSSGMDRTLRVWKYEDAESGTGSLTSTLELYGHKSSADSLAVHAPSSRILSASSDHTVGLWSTKKNDAPAAPETVLPAANKRRKLSNSKPIPQRGPLSVLQGHQSQVADVCFDEKDPTVAYSASWDHSVKSWDLTTSACVDTRTTAQSLFSICHLPDARPLGNRNFCAAYHAHRSTSISNHSQRYDATRPHQVCRLTRSRPQFELPARLRQP